MVRFPGLLTLSSRLRQPARPDLMPQKTSAVATLKPKAIRRSKEIGQSNMVPLTSVDLVT
jgi:hypothetical protein